MALRDEIIAYTDKNGLVAPNRVPPGTVRGSDNGPRFTSELYLFLLYSGELGAGDSWGYLGLIPISYGILRRAPGAQDQEGPDDHYAIASVCKQLELRSLAGSVLYHGLTHFLFLNTPNPNGYTYPKDYYDQNVAGKINWNATLFRQPQLIAAFYAASGKARFWHGPLFGYAALCILLAGKGKPLSDTDARTLSWHLIQTVADESFLCWLATKIWYRRLYKDYGPGGMKEVAKLYYRDDHPFQRYWIDKPPGGFKLPVISMIQTINVVLAGLLIWRFL